MLWVFSRRGLWSKEKSSGNQFISINLSRHLYRSRCFIFFSLSLFTLFGYVHFYFYNQFSRVRACQGLKFPFFFAFFHTNLIKRICFMSILIELLGERARERKWKTGSSFFLLYRLFSPSNCSHFSIDLRSSNISFSNKILLCVRKAFAVCDNPRDEKMLKMLIKKSHLGVICIDRNWQLLLSNVIVIDLMAFQCEWI